MGELNGYVHVPAALPPEETAAYSLPAGSYVESRTRIPRTSSPQLRHYTDGAFPAPHVLKTD
jgi:hypothetical protein